MKPTKLLPLALLALSAAPAMATSLIVNGSFETVSATVPTYIRDIPNDIDNDEDSVSFLTDYYLDSRNGQGASGNQITNSGFGYAGIVTNSQAWHGSFANFGAQDGSRFLIVNGAGSNYTVWEQSVAGAIPGATYEFSFWARNSYHTNPAELAITAYFGVNQLSLTADLDTAAANNGWVRFSALWTGLLNPTLIRMVDNEIAFDGNDFSIDNIQLNQVVLVPLPAHLGAAGLLMLAAIRRRRAC